MDNPLSHLTMCIVVALLAYAAASPAFAQAPPEDEPAADMQSGTLDDSSGSIEAISESREDLDDQGWQFAGDMRLGYIRSEVDSRDGSSSTDTRWQGRFRIGGTNRLVDWLVGGARLATTCSSDTCDPGLTFDDNIPTRSTIEDGDISLDELYLHAFRLERFDVAIGRLQTKFVARAGVFAKSLDRNDSHNFNVNWTDGVHGTVRLENDSVLHLILEYNSSDGPSNVRRGPIDYSDSDARVGYFLAWESKRRLGPIHQRGFDVTYLPSSLLKDGTQTGPVDDYVGMVGRFASAYPLGDSDKRLTVAAEVGYAPETPTQAGLGLAGQGDADGFALTFAASIMDFRPNHSIGINYGEVDEGWLLSPQYRNNERLAEIRYLWRRSPTMAFDFRVRQRKELNRLEGESRKRDETDFFARFTLGFSR